MKLMLTLLGRRLAARRLRKRRTIPAAQYDAIVKLANELGGVGAGSMFVTPEVDGAVFGMPAPNCLYGIAAGAGVFRMQPGVLLDAERGRALAGLTAREVDTAVCEVARLLNNPEWRRVPVLELFAHLGVRRGT